MIKIIKYREINNRKGGTRNSYGHQKCVCW